MFRLLFWIVVIMVAVWGWRRYKAYTLRRQQAKEAPSTRMVRCATCRVHLPEVQALNQDGHWYCSRAHLEQDTRPRDH